MKRVRYLLVDGNNLAFRCFYGVKLPPRPTAMPTHAIYGFLNSLLTIAQHVQADYRIVCFDCGRSQRRMQILPAYKSNRPPTPEDFKVQMPPIKQLIMCMGGVCCEQAGVEADDCLAGWAAFAAQAQESAVLVSADKDLMQCVGAFVSQLIPTKEGWQWIDADGVVKKFGVAPEQIVDFLALMGDASDHYEGIPGVGPKTAAHWLQQYRSIEGIYDHLEEIQPKRFQPILQQSRALLQRNRSLAAMDPSLEFQSLRHLLKSAQPDWDAFEALMERLQLGRLAKKFHTDAPPMLQQSALF